MVGTYNTSHNILPLFDNLALSKSLQVKQYVISSIANLLHELPHEFLNELRPTI